MSENSENHPRNDEAENKEGENSNHYSLPPNVLNALEQIPLIRTELCNIGHKLNKVDDIERKANSMHSEIWGPDGLNSSVQHIAQQAQDSDLDINQLFQENKVLKRDIELLKSVVINLDRKVRQQGREITDLRERSMRDNILVHNFAEDPNEILTVKLKDVIKQMLGVDVDFVRAHRNSPKPNPNGKPRIITAKLSDRGKKDEILRAQKEKKSKKESLPFYITPQSPPEIVENRKKLYEISETYKKQNIQTRVVRDKLVFPDGSTYKDKLAPPNAEDILTVEGSESEKLGDINLESSDCISDSGDKILAVGTNVASLNEVRRLYRKVSIMPEYAKCDHRILVYRYKDREGNIHQGYNDDGEHGAGRRLLDNLTRNNQMDAGIVVTRWYGGRHLGPKRFNMMMDAINQVSTKLQ